MQLFGRKRKRMLRNGKAFVAQNMEGSKKKDAEKKNEEENTNVLLCTQTSGLNAIQ